MHYQTRLHLSSWAYFERCLLTWVLKPATSTRCFSCTSLSTTSGSTSKDLRKTAGYFVTSSFRCVRWWQQLAGWHQARGKLSNHRAYFFSCFQLKLKGGFRMQMCPFFLLWHFFAVSPETTISRLHLASFRYQTCSSLLIKIEGFFFF